MDVIEEYTNHFEKPVQNKLNELRKTIERYLPEETTIKISYGMPTYVYYGNLVHFAAFKNHVGFFIGSGQMELFATDLNGYDYTKSGFHIQFNQVIPEELIARIIAYRVEENKNKKMK